MAKYAYKALQADGRPTEGEIDLPGERDLQAFFVREKLTPLRVAEKGAQAPVRARRRFVLFRQRRLFESELIAFTRQFAAAYGAGMSVSATLELLSKQLGHEGFRASLLEISELIKAGKGLTEAFQTQPDYFDSTYCAILNSGEVSGNLDAVMDYSAGLLEKKLMHKEKIRSTFLYPKLVVGMIAITVAIVVVFVIPQFAKLYDKFEAPLPLPTLLMVKFSNFVTTFWWLWIFLVIAAPFVKNWLHRNEKFMLWLHEVMVDMPILGSTFLKIELTHFCTTFALLMRSGIRITEAARIAITSMRNSFVREQMVVIIPVIEQGGTLAKALASIPLLPPLMSSMIAIGEESGTLDRLLDRVASLFDHETDLVLKKLPTILEPIILGFLFVMVFMLALAVYLPMWRMSSLIRR